MPTQCFSFQHPHPNYQSPTSSSPSSQKRKRSCSSSSPFSTSDVSGRTLKRTRARPNEELVHQYTLQKLFSAAKATPPPAPKQQQQSFMSLFRRSPVTAAAVVQAPLVLRCEDCDRNLSAEVVEEEVRCVGCRRVVCNMGCAASNGVGRVCLECVKYR